MPLPVRDHSPSRRAGQKETEFILNNADVECVVCDAVFLERFIEAGASCEQLKTIVVMRENYEAHPPLNLNDMLESARPRVIPLHAVEGTGARQWLPAHPAPHAPDELFTLSYTSGSTGFPKGVVFNDATMKAEYHRSIFPSNQVGNESDGADYYHADDGR